MLRGMGRPDQEAGRDKLMFIAAGRGKINSDFIKLIRYRQELGREGGSPHPVPIAVDAEGIEHRLNDYTDVLEHLSEVTAIVPATTPMTLVEMWLAGEDAETSPIEIRRWPIVAWVVRGGCGWPEPVAVGCDGMDGSGYCPFYIETPAGQLQQVGFERGSFPTVQACRDDYRRWLVSKEEEM